MLGIGAQIHSFIVQDGEIWFTDTRSGAVYVYNTINEETKNFCTVINDKVEDYMLGGILKNKDQLLVYPRLANSFFVISSTDMSIKRIPLPESHSKVENKYLAGCMVRGKAYVFGAREKNVFAYDFKTEEWHLISAPEVFETPYPDYIYCRDFDCLKPDFIVIGLCQKNAVAFFDCNTESFSIKHVGDNHNRYTGICLANGYIWLSTTENVILQVNEVGQTIGKFFLPSGSSSSGCAYFDGYIWIFPLYNGGIWRINCETLKIEEFEDCGIGVGSVFAYYVDDDLWFFSNNKRKMFQVKKDNVVNCYEIYLPDIESRYIRQERRAGFDLKNSQRIICYEDELFDLEDYLNVYGGNDVGRRPF